MKLTKPGLRLLPHLPLVLCMGLGMFLVWYGTVWGAGLISDSYQYTASARNFVSGNGFSLPYGDGELEPMTKYPPMFSVVLAVFEGLGLTALQGARIVNILLMGVNTLLVFLSTQRLTASPGFSLLASLLFAISPALVEIHSWALSEPLYICLGLASFLLLQKYFEETRGAWLILASLAVSCAFLTRYAGLSLVISISIVVLLSQAAWKKRLKDLFLFGFIAILPAALWTLRGYLLTSTLNDRLPGFHPLTAGNYVSAVDTVYGWLLPPSLVQGREKVLLALTVVVLIGLALLFMKFHRDRFTRLRMGTGPQDKIVLLHLLYFVVYGLVIVASKTWLDPDIGLSDRILSPMLVSLLILIAAGLSLLWTRVDRVRPLVVLISLGLIAYYAAGTFTIVQRFHETGIGIARRGWNRSEVIQSLRSYSAYSMYTNSNSSLYLWSDRTGYSIPEFEALKDNGAEAEVLLVIFHHVPPTGRRLEELVSGLELLEEDQVASVYALPPGR